MKMHRWYNISAEDKRIAYNLIAEKINLPAFAVEKDWWVVQTLSILFQTEIGKHLVFKGGTSLSKGWDIIDRFSEDIDLAVDRSFFGFEGVLKKKDRTRLRKASREYIEYSLFSILKEDFASRGLTNVKLELEEIKTSDQDPVIINVNYPNVIEPPGYLEPPVRIEIGSRSLMEPFEERSIISFVDEQYPTTEFAQSSILIPTVLVERTFLEKMFLLHEEYQRPKEKSRINRLSRHLYDIYKISKTDYAQKALENRELYETIVKHRESFTHLGGVDYNLHNPQTINFIPSKEFLSKWEDDYKVMQEEMIHGQSPPFEELIDVLKALNEQINDFEWKMEMIFR